MIPQVFQTPNAVDYLLLRHQHQQRPRQRGSDRRVSCHTSRQTASNRHFKLRHYRRFPLVALYIEIALLTVLLSTFPQRFIRRNFIRRLPKSFDGSTWNSGVTCLRLPTLNELLELLVRSSFSSWTHLPLSPSKSTLISQTTSVDSKGFGSL